MTSFAPAVEAQLRSDLGPLNDFSVGDLGALTTLVLEQLQKKDAKTMIREVTNFASQKGIKRKAVLENGIRGLMTLLQTSANVKATAADVSRDAGRLGLDSAHASAVEQSWRLFADVDPFDSETLRQLVDIEWRFGVTCASDSDPKIGKTFLQLKLVLQKDNKIQKIHLELSLPQFYDFLAQLEQAKLSIDDLTSSSPSVN